jgi:hypothetical protein
MTEAELVDAKIAQLQARMVAVERVVEELRAGLIGDVRNVGALELIRTTATAVSGMEKSVQTMQSAIEQFQQERWTLRGIIVAVGLTCGFLSWASTFLVRLWK